MTFNESPYGSIDPSEETLEELIEDQYWHDDDEWDWDEDDYDDDEK